MINRSNDTIKSKPNIAVIKQPNAEAIEYFVLVSLNTMRQAVHRQHTQHSF